MRTFQENSVKTKSCPVEKKITIVEMQGSEQARKQNSSEAPGYWKSYCGPGDFKVKE